MREARAFALNSEGCVPLPSLPTIVDHPKRSEWGSPAFRWSLPLPWAEGGDGKVYNAWPLRSQSNSKALKAVSSGKGTQKLKFLNKSGALFSWLQPPGCLERRKREQANTSCLGKHCVPSAGLGPRRDPTPHRSGERPAGVPPGAAERRRRQGARGVEGSVTEVCKFLEWPQAPDLKAPARSCRTPSGPESQAGIRRGHFPKNP